MNIRDKLGKKSKEELYDLYCYMSTAELIHELVERAEEDPEFMEELGN